MNQTLMEVQLQPLQVLTSLPGSRVLVFAPHPDDEVFGCGGALRQFTAAGIPVRVIVATDGGEGPPEGIDRSSYVALRKEESCRAAAQLGSYELLFWPYEDRQLRYGERMVQTCLAAIKAWQADLVLAPSHYEIHPDHRALAMCVYEAARRWRKAHLALYEVGQPLPHPNVLLDISAEFEAKQAAMRCFESQLARQDYAGQIAALNRYRTYQAQGLDAAEAYLLCSAEALSSHDALGLFRSEHARQAALGLIADEARAPLVSIIVRSIDRPTLDEALDSVALQTYPNIEVVLVNAKGPDHRPMPTWCGRFPLRVVSGEGPLDRAPAANRGLDAAQGEYLLFLDDDDWIEPDHIATLVASAMATSPALPVVYSGVRTFGDTPTRTFHRDFDRLRLFAGNYIPIHAVLFSRRLVAAGCRFDETLSLYEDWDFLIQLALHTPFRKIDAISAHYRVQSGTGSGVQHHHHSVIAGHQRIYAKWRHRLAEELTDEEWYQTLDRVQLLDTLRAQLDERQNERDQLLTERDQLLTERDQLLTERDQLLTERDQLRTERDQLRTERDQLRTERDQLRTERDQLRTERDQLRTERDQLRTERDQLRTERQMILASTSWRLTAPLRVAVTRLRIIKRVIPTLTQALRLSLARHGAWGLLTHTLRVGKEEGLAGLIRRIRARMTHTVPPAVIDYPTWLIHYGNPSPKEERAARQRIAAWRNPPLISIVMPTWRSNLRWLQEAVESVQQQWYPNWQLCIADDASPDAELRDFLKSLPTRDQRIDVTFRAENGHISAASNSAFALARGQWVVFLDHDDRLAPHALYCVARAIEAHPEAQIIYSDEDKIDEAGRRFDPHFKSDWNPDLFYSHNYITHLCAIRRSLIEQVGGFRTGVEGAQDYDLLLRCLPHVTSDQIIHIPRILYHWRAIPGSTARASSEKHYSAEAGRKALQDHFRAIGEERVVVEHGPYPNFYRIRWPIPEPAPLVTLLMPTRDQKAVTEAAVRSILEKTRYVHFELLILDNGSQEAETLAWFEAIQKEDARVRVLRWDPPFNYSAINNFGARHARGELLCLINNDIEVIEPEWLGEMVSHALRPEIGCVGAKLLYDNGTVQHGGVIVGIGSVAGHAHRHFPHDHPGYYCRLVLTQNFSAVTGACLLVRREIFETAGGLDEQHLKIALNDVDFCLKVRAAGFRNVWTPYALLTHHESVSRGYEDTPEKRARFASETTFMKQKWGRQFESDPYYNPNLTLEREDFTLATHPRVDELT